MAFCDECEVRNKRIRELEDDSEEVADLAQIAVLCESRPDKIRRLTDRLRAFARELGARAIMAKVGA